MTPPSVAPSLLTLDTTTIVQAMLLSLVLGLAVAALHRLALVDRIVAPTVSMSLVLLSMGGSMVMLVIGTSLARAFSLVGALAIVRFRTRIENPVDVSFVFLAIIVGVATGTLAWKVALIGTGIVGLAVLVLGALPRGGGAHLVRIDVVAHESGEEDLEATLDRFVRRRWLEQARSLRFGEALSLWYRVSLRSGVSLPDLLRSLSALERVERVVVLANDELVDGVD